MDKTYRLQEQHIQVTIEKGIIRIKNNISLWHFFKKNVKQRTQQLIDCILSDYLSEIGKPLHIHPKSFAIEIWGHLYYEYIVLLICRWFQINPSTKRIKLLLRSSEMIDCGEKGKDSNRFLWDLLTPLYGFIAFFLPKNIINKNLKN